MYTLNEQYVVFFYMILDILRVSRLKFEHFSPAQNRE